MRLLNVHTLNLHDFAPNAAQPYAIASHKWGKDELTFQELESKLNLHKAGFEKIQGFTEYVRKNVPDIDWVWIDTCCIDKRNNVELSEAINSMFQWYRDSAICIAYLADVPSPTDERDLNSSVWFRRGWTLQELLAAREVLFLSRQWQVIGYKGDQKHVEHGSIFQTGQFLNPVIATITGIPEAVLRDFDESRALSTEERLNWMSNRSTERVEDRWYCLLGIFDVSMNIRYGGTEADRTTRNRFLAKLRKHQDRSIKSSSDDASEAIFESMYIRTDM